MCACLFVLVINCIIWGAGLGFQVQFDRASVEADEVLLGATTPWDFEQSSSAGGPISLLMFCTSTSQVNGAEADMKITLEMRLIRDLLTIL
jgi:hypothetical protein